MDGWVFEPPLPLRLVLELEKGKEEPLPPTSLVLWTREVGSIPGSSACGCGPRRCEGCR